jgi:hypothetical protein
MLMSRLTNGGQLTEHGDLLVWPSPPGVGFPACVRRVTGLAEGEPPIVVPPSGSRGVESLCEDRLAAPEFVAGLRTLIPPARATGPGGPPGGVAFPAGRGGGLVTSKAVFPAIAAGNTASITDTPLTARVPISRHRRALACTPTGPGPAAEQEV